MIHVKDATCKIMGAEDEVLSDITMVLRIWYQNFKEIYNEEEANRVLMKIGKLAVMPEEEFRKGPNVDEL